MEKTKYFVVQDQQGKFLAIDSYSGGYPWYPEDFWSAELFKATASKLEYIQSCGENFVVREVFLGDPIPFENMAFGAAAIDIRREALAKLSPIEKKALGLC